MLRQLATAFCKPAFAQCAPVCRAFSSCPTPMPQFKEEFVKNPRNNLTLYTAQYLPPSDKPATANLIFHHGYGEHVGRYVPVFSKMADAGIAVHTFDAAAHGKSEPKEKKERAIIWKFKDAVDDVYFVMERLLKASKTEHLPTFVGGQSMGGLIASYVVLRDQSKYAGLILHSAAIDVEWTPVLKAQAPVSKMLSKMMPRARIVPAVRPETVSQDPAVVKAYLEDPLNTTGNVPVRTAQQLLSAFKGLKRHYKDFKLPIYACHGTSDHCTSLPGVKYMLDHVSSTDKTLNAIEGGFHEMIHGPEMDQCTQAMIDWMLSRKARSKI